MAIIPGAKTWNRDEGFKTDCRIININRYGELNI